jgi:dolichyl-phosphate-mannose-protein mannosyltransferase
LLVPEPAPALRVLPAAFGTTLVPLVYVMLRQLGANRRIATFGATLMLLENALLVISRILVVDIVLIAFGMMALVAYLAARTRAGAARWAYLALAALAAGASLSIKWTGASALGIILVAWLVDAQRRRRAWRRVLAEGALLVLAPVAIYLASFAIHFAVLTRSGPGDVYMPSDFRATLVGDAQYTPGATLGFWTKLVEVHRAMATGNEALEHAKNPASSPWYTWPVMKHPVSLFGDPSVPGDKRMMILLGNPVIWWGVLIAFVGAWESFVRQRPRWRGREFALVFLTGGVLLNYVPFMAIRRLMYLYHYLFALTLLIVLGAYVLGVTTGSIDDDAPPWRFATRRQALMFGGLAVLVLAGFVYYAPFTYGWTIGASAWDHRFWVLHPHL